jgi:hypothetical protein
MMPYSVGDKYLVYIGISMTPIPLVRIVPIVYIKLFLKNVFINL